MQIIMPLPGLLGIIVMHLNVFFEVYKLCNSSFSHLFSSLKLMQNFKYLQLIYLKSN